MNLKVVNFRRYTTLLTIAIFFLSAALPLSQAISNCPTSGVPVTANLTLNSPCTYTSENGITLGANSITLNCNGNSITFSGSGNYVGIGVIGYSAVTIENCHVNGFHTGFDIVSSPLTTLKGNTATNAVYGFDVLYSPSTVLGGSAAMGNTATGSSYGFYIYQSFNNQISGNTATGNTNGFYVVDSVGTIINGNTASMNTNSGFYFTYSLFPNTQYKVANNKADSNGATGYYDYTVGAGSLGLGNTYTGNECNSNGIYGSDDAVAGIAPAGLCTPQG